MAEPAIQKCKDNNPYFNGRLTINTNGGNTFQYFESYPSGLAETASPSGEINLSDRFDNPTYYG